MRALRRRVVVTGVGLVSPLGVTTEETWAALIAGRSGIETISRFDASDLPVRIGGEVRGFDATRYLQGKDLKKVDRFAQFAIAAAQQAVDDADLRISATNAERVGVVIGTGIGGIDSLEEGIARFQTDGYRKVSPFLIPRAISNMAPGQVAIRFGALGANYAVASACASGGHAIAEALRLIRSGEQDFVLAGGAEASVTPMCVAGFAAMRALSVRNHHPSQASRPFEKDRDGFVIAEGAGLLVLEELEIARGRRARIYAELVGQGANADAHHITMPAPEGVGAARCMQLALRDAEMMPAEVDYVNAHGTATQYNDVNETQAIKAVFGEHAARVAVSSTKSMTGHALGAAGGMEAAFTVLAIHHQIAPPTINHDTPDPDCDLDYVPNRMREMKIDCALSNSFGFGGANSCLAFRRFES